MKLRRFVQSTFVFEVGGARILVDPGLYNVTRGFSPSDFGKLDGIIITHKHADHFDMDLTKALVEASSPKILTNHEIAGTLASQRITCQTGTVGETVPFCGVDLALTLTDHVVGGEAIVNFGFVLAHATSRAFYTSDTRLIDPQLLGSPAVFDPAVLLLPISNRGLVMGFDDALYFANEIRPKAVIPMHYNSPKDEPRVNPTEFVARAHVLANHLAHLKVVDFKILGIGDEATIE